MTTAAAFKQYLAAYIELQNLNSREPPAPDPAKFAGNVTIEFLEMEETLTTTLKEQNEQAKQVQQDLMDQAEPIVKAYFTDSEDRDQVEFNAEQKTVKLNRETGLLVVGDMA